MCHGIGIGAPWLGEHERPHGRSLSESIIKTFTGPFLDGILYGATAHSTAQMTLRAKGYYNNQVRKPPQAVSLLGRRRIPTPAAWMKPGVPTALWGTILNLPKPISTS